MISVIRGLFMEEVLNANVSILVAQVRQAEASHKIDTTHQLLRGKHFTGPSRVVYLGDVSKALLAQLSQPETPVFDEAPGYNEQRWKLKTTSSSLNIKIHSTAYWGWGLLTSGYLNVITLEGPLNERARLVLDMTSSLGQSPWEMAHLNSAEKWLKRHEPSLSLKHNEQIWKALRQAARSNLKEAIERMKEQIDTVWSEGIDDADEWRSIIDDDLHMARQALAEDNAPGVERALARMEASLIQIKNDPEANYIEAPISVLSDGSDRVSGEKTKPVKTVDLTRALSAEDDVPFVDLTQLPSVDGEE
jgi:hypothetical protein